MMRAALLLTIIGSSPLATAASARVGESGTDPTSPMIARKEEEEDDVGSIISIKSPTSNNSPPEKGGGGAHYFFGNKSGKKGKSGSKSKSGKSSSADGEGGKNSSQMTPFDKSGKSKSKGAKNDSSANGVAIAFAVDDEPHKLFPKKKSSKKQGGDGSSGAKSEKGDSGHGGAKTGKSTTIAGGDDGPFLDKSGKGKGDKKGGEEAGGGGSEDEVVAGDDTQQQQLSDANADNDESGSSSGKTTEEDGEGDDDSDDGDVNGNVSSSSSSSSSSPTLRPTCSGDDVLRDDFDLCIAIDGSGSVCNRGRQFTCLGCSPSVFCRDAGFDVATCCNNFGNVKEFSSLMVNSLEEMFPVEKSFSVVQFAAETKVESDLGTAEETIRALEELEYIGGYTSHASAIEACRETLSSSSSSSGDNIDDNRRRKFILLITDGVSTWPTNNPEGTALAAATLAKEEDGAIIIPIFISADEYDEDALDFMRRLSSDGKVFDVSDFESLGSLQSSLVDQVSCS